MKYYLVAVLDRDSNRELEALQKPLHKKGRNFKKPPYMAIPLDTIEDPDRDRLLTFISDLLKPFRYFHVEMEGRYVNSSEDKISGLPVKNFGYVKKIQRHLNEYMTLSGFKAAPERNEEKDFILSMSQERLPREADSSKRLFDTEDNMKKFQVDRIELWKTMAAKKDSIVFSIPLKNPNII